MDPCGAASVIDAPLMKNIKPADKYGLPAIRMTTLGSFTPIYKDVGELHFVDDNGNNSIILGYVQYKPLQGHKNFALLCQDILVDLDVDMNYQMRMAKTVGPTPVRRLNNNHFHYSDKPSVKHTVNLTIFIIEEEIARKSDIAEKRRLNRDLYECEDRCTCEVRVVDSISVEEYNRCHDGAASLNLYTEGSNKRLSSPLTGAASTEPWDKGALTVPSTKNVSKLHSLPANFLHTENSSRGPSAPPNPSNLKPQ